MAKTFKTTVHHYYFESGSNPGYKAMVERIKANAEGRGHWMNTFITDKGKPLGRANTSEEIEVESAYLFDNQMNTADGRRLFDWFEEYQQHTQVKRGHWVEITPEIAEARRLTHKCGYCGKQYGPHHEPIPEGMFCGACLDSEHLKPAELHLLRLLPVSDRISGGGRAELTEAERAELMPRYIARQTTGSDSRANQKRQKQRADVLAKFTNEVADATTERDGMLWLWDHGVSLDNVIYYNHSQRFSFGWRSPVAPEVKSALLDLLCEFPFAYEIKATDGKTK